MTAVDFHFDPMCPFAYHASVWIRSVRADVGIKVNWRFFSLEEVNRFEGKKHPWDREWSYGWSLMRVGVLLRRLNMELLDEWYARVGSRLHRDGGKPHDRDEARRILVEMGVDGGILDEALADPSTHAEVRSDHERVVAAGGFGVPTLFLSDDRCVYGPVLVDPPVGVEAVNLWNIVSGFSAFDQVYELQRPKTAVDEARISNALRPYVRGRDWVSVDRGKVIDLEESACEVRY